MIDLEIRDHIAVITINRPEARNAVNAEVAQGIEAAMDKLEDDDSLFVGIIAGAGTVFCAGADLKAINSGQAGGLNTAKGGFAGFVRRDRQKPVIAAVDGPAYAGGCEIALACDMIVASAQAKFGLSEVKRSLVAAGGGLFRLPERLPQNIAMEAILTGDPIEAQRAHELGMVNVLTDNGAALEGALALAERVCLAAPLAVRESRKVVLAARRGESEDALWDMSAAGFGALARTEDFQEGPRAFIEKRAPQWKGR